MRKIAIAACLVSVLAHAPAILRAQSPATNVFEVASVKASPPQDPSNLATMIPSMQMTPDGSLRVTNLPLRLLIRIAYKVEDENISGGPAWITTSRYDVSAKTPAGATTSEDAMRERMQALLQERFKLKTHMDTREANFSALVLSSKDGKLGPDLKPSTADCSHQQEDAARLAEEVRKNPAGALAALQSAKCGVIPVPSMGTGGAPQLKIRMLGQPMSVVSTMIQQMLGRPVIDKTGLTGTYDAEMEMPLDPDMLRRLAGQAGIALPAGAAQQLPAYDGPALATILNDRLGLKLESQKGPVPVLVIDSAEMPTAD